MVRNILFAPCLLILLTSCTTQALIQTKTPSNISQTCDPIPVFDGKTADDLVGYNLDLIDKYKQCAARHSGCL